MATFFLSPVSTIFQYFTDAGIILAGGKINTYKAGTSTPTTTWTDQTGATPNANPIILASNGRLNNVQIWQQAQVPIKVIVTDANNNQLGPTFDNISGVGDTTLTANSYYGGTDTGSANAYILTFTANFLSYVAGTIIYWVPSNTNTGASTLNVNGLGAISIVNADTSAVSAGQIIANQIAAVAVQGGQFVLLTNYQQTSGSFTGTSTGITGSPTMLCRWVKNGRVVVLQIGGVTGGSTSVSFTITGLPATIQPATIGSQTTTLLAEDNTASINAWGIINALSGTITFQTFSGAWTGSGSKGLPQGATLTYFLT